MRYFIIFIFPIILSLKFHNKEKYEVDYEMLLNFKGPIKYDAKLILNSKSSLFLYELANKDSIYNEFENENSINMRILDSSQFFIFTHRNENILVEQKRPAYSKKKYTVWEPLPVIDWKITEEQKKIGNFDCQKATANFRGRKYDAWFTTSIPINFGPWKLNGLPGLILYAKDERGEVVFGVKKIISQSKNILSNNLGDTSKSISLNEFIKIEKQEEKDFKKRFLSKFDRSVNVKIEIEKESIELQYEK